MLLAVVCSGAGRGQRAAFEDVGEELGGGGEMFLVPGPYAPPQVGEADLQLVAVVAYGGVNEGALWSARRPGSWSSPGSGSVAALFPLVDRALGVGL